MFRMNAAEYVEMQMRRFFFKQLGIDKKCAAKKTEQVKDDLIVFSNAFMARWPESEDIEDYFPDIVNMFNACMTDFTLSIDVDQCVTYEMDNSAKAPVETAKADCCHASCTKKTIIALVMITMEIKP